MILIIELSNLEIRRSHTFIVHRIIALTLLFNNHLSCNCYVLERRLLYFKTSVLFIHIRMGKPIMLHFLIYMLCCNRYILCGFGLLRWTLMNDVCDLRGGSQLLETVIKHGIIGVIAVKRGFVLHVMNVNLYFRRHFHLSVLLLVFNLLLLSIFNGNGLESLNNSEFLCKIILFA